MQEQVSDSNTLFIIAKRSCEVCERLISGIKDIKHVNFSIHWMTPSRIPGMNQLSGTVDGLPALIKHDLIPEVPCLYDPISNDIIIGMKEIRKYFIDSGLADDYSLIDW